MNLRGLYEFVKPHRTVPILPWTAVHRWDLSVKRVLIVIFGLAAFGLGDALIIESGLGNTPWSVLAQGISLKSGITIGTATLLVSVVVLLSWIPLHVRLGFSTIANILVIATFIEIGTRAFPLQDGILAGLVYVIVGIVMVGAGSALYITCGLGKGPRDGMMTGLHNRTGVRVGRVRLGTLLFALFIGQSLAISFGALARLTAK
jgi:uncharacterized protein